MTVDDKIENIFYFELENSKAELSLSPGNDFFKIGDFEIIEFFFEKLNIKSFNFNPLISSFEKIKNCVPSRDFEYKNRFDFSMLKKFKDALRFLKIYRSFNFNNSENISFKNLEKIYLSIGANTISSSDEVYFLESIISNESTSVILEIFCAFYFRKLCEFTSKF
ncbi:hypothetical protein CWI36_2217p0010 [Hamiltosporidium magnivora]|uniref:Uncharacterized protein n=1 Tax=Hamiltosporidium magnivora TaxID=148818 RepID=A0A4Q9KW35_9MICR|nr:hypothetical protein CWI36_2217p0010 [Hamiltosporidium magnivora]